MKELALSDILIKRGSTVALQRGGKWTKATIAGNNRYAVVATYQRYEGCINVVAEQLVKGRRKRVSFLLGEPRPPVELQIMSAIADRNLDAGERESKERALSRDLREKTYPGIPTLTKNQMTIVSD
jgi:hypothetical protein